MAKPGRPRTEEWTWQKCEQCGVEYERPGWSRDRRRFHSRECYRAWWAEHRKQPATPAPRRVVPTVCTIEGCGKPHKGHGYCEMHLVRWRKYGDPTVVRKKGPKPLEQRPKCSVEGCEKVVVGQGYCRNHYMRQYRRGGDPAVMLQRGPDLVPMTERRHMFTQGAPDECWEWQGATNKHGYGVTGVRGVGGILAHRAVYEELVGPITEDTLDHLCANRLCVNPHHLDPCSARQNQLRGGEPHFELRGKTGHVVWE